MAGPGNSPSLTSFFSDIDKAPRLEVITSSASYLSGRDQNSGSNGFLYVGGKAAGAVFDLYENQVNFWTALEAGLLSFC